MKPSKSPPAAITTGYYDWLDRAPSARQTANETLALQIHSAFTASDDTYGMLRVRAQLRDEGIKASRKRVARLMRRNHWRGVSRRRSYCLKSAFSPSATNASARPQTW